MGEQQTYWNGELADARRVRVIVADDGRFPNYWAREFVGQERDAVEVLSGDAPDDVFPFYLDDEDGTGWVKVTTGRGSPRWGHRTIQVEEVMSPRA
jgi:hypothetical protein